MKAVLHTIKHEVMKAIPPTVFFFIILHIVALIRTLMMKGTGVSLPVSTSILIASLVLGKSVLVADMLPFINRFPEKPLIWNVTWKTLMYALVALAVHYLERLYEFWKKNTQLHGRERHVVDFDELASILGSADFADYFDIRVLRLFRTDARIGP